MSTGPDSEACARGKGFLIVVSGPSAVGKNTLVNAARQRLPDLSYSVSATRPPRPGERDGVDYFFLSDDEFSRRVAAGEFLEWAEYCGYRYGTPRRSIERLLSEGKTVILDIDTQGAQQIREKMPEGVFVFLLPPSWEELRKRIQQRGTESPATATARLRLAAREADAITQYDYYIVNDDPDRAASELEAIIRAERCRVRRFSHRAWLQRFRTEAAALGAEEGEG